ncbi:MAG: hypothetical protein CR967_02700 [Proteobacteria bacterium]|nr:MAG: hypothetical protein CR967_02700 [Pseudomonadota bacterium]
MSEDFNTFLHRIRLLGKRTGFAITHKRELILRVLFEAKEPLDAKQISIRLKEKHLLKISITLVYKMLNILEELYILHAISLPPNNTKYYSIMKARSKSHLICKKCKKIVTFCDKITLSHLDRILDKHGFILSNLKVTLYGICKDCKDE